MAARHLLSTMQLYVDAVVQQSSDRAHDRLRSIDGYWAVRRHSSGCYPSFALMELELDIPENVYRHPLLDRMRDCALYLICAGNVSPPPFPPGFCAGASDREKRTSTPTPSNAPAATRCITTSRRLCTSST